jgi:hypothetical protein
VLVDQSFHVSQFPVLQQNAAEPVSSFRRGNVPPPLGRREPPPSGFEVLTSVEGSARGYLGFGHERGRRKTLHDLGVEFPRLGELLEFRSTYRLTGQSVVRSRKSFERGHLSKHLVGGVDVTSLQKRLGFAHANLRGQCVGCTVRKQLIIGSACVGKILELLERHAHGVEGVTPQRRFGMSLRQLAVGCNRFSPLVKCVLRLGAKEQRLIATLALRKLFEQLSERLDGGCEVFPLATLGRGELAPSEIKQNIFQLLESRALSNHGRKGGDGRLPISQLQVADPFIVARLGGQRIAWETLQKLCPFLDRQFIGLLVLRVGRTFVDAKGFRRAGGSRRGLPQGYPCGGIRQCNQRDHGGQHDGPSRETVPSPTVKLPHHVIRLLWRNPRDVDASTASCELPHCRESAALDKRILTSLFFYVVPPRRTRELELESRVRSPLRTVRHIA